MIQIKQGQTESWAACVLTHDHQGELKAPLDRLPVHLVGEACKANISFQILLLLQDRKKYKRQNHKEI